MKRLIRFLLRVVIALFILLNIVAAFHAYKFTHFYNDSEEAVTAPERMSTWQKTKTILFGIRHAKSKNLFTPDTAYQTVKLVTDDKLQLEAWHLTHKKSKAKGTVILFHGHGGSKSGVMEEAYAFFNMGYDALMVDFRAHGGSEGNTCTIGMKESKDVKAAYDYITAKGEKNIILWGISMGAASIAHAIDECKLNPAKVILEMPFGSLSAAVKGRVRIMGLPEQPASMLLTFWGGTEQGFWAFNMKPSDYVKQIHCPVLLQWGKNDQRVTRTEIDSIYNNITTRKKLVIYDNSGHESLCKKENEKWIQEINNFLLH